MVHRTGFLYLYQKKLNASTHPMREQSRSSYTVAELDNLVSISFKREKQFLNSRALVLGPDIAVHLVMVLVCAKQTPAYLKHAKIKERERLLLVYASVKDGHLAAS